MSAIDPREEAEHPEGPIPIRRPAKRPRLAVREKVLVAAVVVLLLLVGVHCWPSSEDEPNEIFIDDVDISRGDYVLYVNVTLKNGRDWPYHPNEWSIELTMWEGDRLKGDIGQKLREELLPGDIWSCKFESDGDRLTHPHYDEELLLFIVLKKNNVVKGWEVIVVQGADIGVG